MRLVIVNSTDVYIPLPINRSPFNIGYSIELSPFTTLQVEDLAQRHKIKLIQIAINKMLLCSKGLEVGVLTPPHPPPPTIS